MCIKVYDQFKTAYAHLAKLLVEQGALPDSDLIISCSTGRSENWSTRNSPGWSKRRWREGVCWMSRNY